MGVDMLLLLESEERFDNSSDDDKEDAGAKPTGRRLPDILPVAGGPELVDPDGPDQPDDRPHGIHQLGARIEIRSDKGIGLADSIIAIGRLRIKSVVNEYRRQNDRYGTSTSPEYGAYFLSVIERSYKEVIDSGCSKYHSGEGDPGDVV